MFLMACLFALGLSPAWAGEIFRPDVPIPEDWIRETVTGTVVDDNGKPVAGVQVWHMMDVWQDEAKTDANGRFQLNVVISRLPEIPPRILFPRVIASSDDGRRGFLELQKVLTDFSLLKDLRVELKEARKFDVRVLDHAGQAVPDAAVLLDVFSYALDFSKTNSEGLAQLLAPPDIRINHLYVDGKERGFDYIHYGGKFRRPTSPIEEDEQGRIVMRLAKVHPLTIRAVDRHGNAVPAAMVRFAPGLPGKGSPCTSLYSRLLTSQAGEATIYVPEELNEYTSLMCHQLGYFSHSQDTADLATRTQPITYVFEKRIPVSGKVIFADGTPAPGLPLYIRSRGYAPPEENGESNLLGMPIKTDADGHFEASVRPERCLSLQTRQGINTSDVVHQIVRDQPIKDLVLTIRPTTEVTGKVVDVEGKLVLSSRLYFVPILDDYPQGVPPASILAPPLTDQQRALPPLQFPDGRWETSTGAGQYTIKVPSGKYVISMPHRGMKPVIVEVRDGQPATVDLVAEKLEAATPPKTYKQPADARE